jgi:hypothetical protein
MFEERYPWSLLQRSVSKDRALVSSPDSMAILALPSRESEHSGCAALSCVKTERASAELC